MITISKEYSFDSSHMLWVHNWTPEKNAAVFGKCSRLHGHTYHLTVTVTGHVNPNDGMILNYFDLDKVVKPYVDEELDHRNLNEVFEDMLTTAENMVQKIGQTLVDRLTPVLNPSAGGVESVMLQETPKTSAVWFT